MRRKNRREAVPGSAFRTGPAEAGLFVFAANTDNPEIKDAGSSSDIWRTDTDMKEKNEL